MRTVIAAGALLLMSLSSAASAQVRVTSTSPGNVQVQAGGGTVRLTLDGYQLTSVTSVRFLLAGRLVGGIAGTLQSAQALAGGTSRLALDLRADRSVAAGSYVLQLVSGTQGITLPTSIAVLPALPQAINTSTTQLPAQQPKAAETISVGPSVTNATPTTVQVRAGGPAQSVVINGSSMNRVVGAYVRRNGNRVLSGIRADLVPSTDPARREIRVSAYGTTGPWGVPVDLVLEYTIGSTRIKAANPLPTPVQITASAPPNVDLVVASCTVEGRVSRATLRNNGSEGATFPYFNPIVSHKLTPGSQDLIDFDMTGPFATPAGGYYIPPGGTVDLQLSVKYSTGAALTEITWIVDPKGVVAESNTANNQRTCRSTAAPTAGSITDLGISAISARPTFGPPQTIFEFTVVLKNIGNVTVPGSGYYVACTIDNGVFGGFYMTRQLAPNETITERLQTKGYSAPGTHVFECIFDPGQKLTESTRNNNARSLVFTVTK